MKTDEEYLKEGIFVANAMCIAHKCSAKDFIELGKTKELRDKELEKEEKE